MTYRKGLMVLDALIWAGICLVVAVLVSGCAHKPAAPIVVPPRAPPPALCQPIEAEPEPAGGIVAPITEQERDLTTRFLQAELDVRFHSRRGWARARLARETYCPK